MDLSSVDTPTLQRWRKNPAETPDDVSLVGVFRELNQRLLAATGKNPDEGVVWGDRPDDAPNTDEAVIWKMPAEQATDMDEKIKAALVGTRPVIHVDTSIGDARIKSVFYERTRWYTPATGMSRNAPARVPRPQFVLRPQPVRLSQRRSVRLRAAQARAPGRSRSSDDDPSEPPAPPLDGWSRIGDVVADELARLGRWS